MASHSLEMTWRSAGASISQTVTKTAGLESNLEETIAGAATDAELVFGIDFSALTFLYMLCDRALTIETNDGSSPDDTIALVAGEPFTWWPDCGHDNPFTADVTSIFATLAAGADATLQIKTLQDPTP